MAIRISGGRKLHTPPGQVTRPTVARVRLAVFNLLQHRIRDARWLDLFCGSGSMGCEALQRGAAHVTAVDCNRSVVALARQNLNMVRTDHQTLCLHRQDVLAWLRLHRPSPAEPAGGGPPAFDLVYADPPYGQELYGAVAAALGQTDLLSPGGLLLLECNSRNVPRGLEGWQTVDQRRYGTTTVLILQPQQPPHR